MKSFFLMLIVILAMSCRKEIVNIEPMNLLYIKSASADEKKVDVEDPFGKYSFPNDLLFKIPASWGIAEVLNNPLLLVENYQVISPDKANFIVNMKDSLFTIKAQKLPFSPEDYSFQTETGDTKFNGILKSDSLVFAVNVLADKIKIKVFNLKTNRLVTDNIASVSNEALTIKIGDEIWKIWLSKISPKGNIFQIYNHSKGGATKICYSLYL